MDILSRRIKELRVDHDMKQGEMGDALGITQNMVSNYENGREPSLDIVLAYAKYFDVSVEYLLGTSNDRKKVSPGDIVALDSMQREAAERGDSAFSRADITRLAGAFVNYYHAGAPAGSAPMDCVKSFLAAAPLMLEAAAQGDAAALLNACNDLARAGLDATNVLAAVLNLNNE